MNTSALVPGTGASQSCGTSVPGSGGAVSLASGADSAASWDAATRPEMVDGSTSAERTEPTCAILLWRTIEITVVWRLTDSPLVVIELPAQRSDASARSVTNTMVSSALPNLAASASALSTTCCAPITDYRPASVRVLSTLTPRNSADGQP